MAIKAIKWAQYDDAVDLVYKGKGKRKENSEIFRNRQTIAMFNGWIDEPDELLHDIEHRANSTITKSKYTAHDAKQIDIIIQHFAAQGINPIFTNQLTSESYTAYTITDIALKSQLAEIAEQNGNVIPESEINCRGITPRHIKETFGDKYRVDMRVFVD